MMPIRSVIVLSVEISQDDHDNVLKAKQRQQIKSGLRMHLPPHIHKEETSTALGTITVSGVHTSFSSKVNFSADDNVPPQFPHTFPATRIELKRSDSELPESLKNPAPGSASALFQQQ